MRIIVLAIHFPLDIDNIRGGVHSAISNLLKGFASYDIQVRLVSFNTEISEEKHVQLTDKIDIVYCPEGSLPFHSLNYLVNCGKQVRKHIRLFKPDLIHYEAGDAFLFTKILGLKKIKHLQTIHGIAIAEARVAKKLKVKLSSYFNGMIEKVMFPKNIIHLSNYSKRTYENKKTDNDSIIPNAVVSNYFDIPLKKKTDNRLLYVGVIDRNKNILFLLRGLHEMVEKGKPYHVDVLGGFKDMMFKEEVEWFIEEHKLANYITFHGWVPQSKVIETVTNIDILVVSSNQESLPMVIAECMAAGRVVIASKVGGIPEMVDHGNTGFLVNNKDLNSLVVILDELHNNNERVLSVAANAKSNATEKYHCVSVAGKTIEFYRKILGNNVA
ncbi:MAG: glycosyltransferase family 4 protein [Bacteroidetes bacterium]|nr:glycosyltransferase family 4 protein [Bacteroidota bacterium]